ncbi:MAG: acyl carrier protein [Caldilineaceae bacterium]|jgi:acyl carrier protein
MNMQQAQPDETKATIKQYITQEFLYDRPEVNLTDDFPVMQQRVIDSLQIIQLLSFLQEKFDLIFNAEDLTLENFASVNEVAALVERYRVVA